MKASDPVLQVTTAHKVGSDEYCQTTFISNTKAAFVLGEKHFRKCFSPFYGCLVAHGKCIFRKCFSVGL